MVSYQSAPSGREGKDADSESETKAGDDEGEAVGSLPGVVNDLPEVAPHEWIYLMS